jgi:predicted nuclease with TOPRIM domain
MKDTIHSLEQKCIRLAADDHNDDDKIKKLKFACNELEERYHHLKDKYDHLEREHHEVVEKCHRLEKSSSSSHHGSSSSEWEVKYTTLSVEITRHEARYRKIMLKNRTIKDRHRSLKVTVKKSGHHDVSSSSSSSGSDSD